MRPETRRDLLIGLLITLVLLLLGEAGLRVYVQGFERKTPLDAWELPDPVPGWKPRV